MPAPTLLLIAHGSRRKASNEEVIALANRMRQSRPPHIADVQVAFLELAEPSIPDALADCVSMGAREILVFPYFLAAGTHVTVDIPEEIATFKNKHPHIQVTITPHLGASPQLAEAILEMASIRQPMAA